MLLNGHTVFSAVTSYFRVDSGVTYESRQATLIALA
jgi:hypothetical protein